MKRSDIPAFFIFSLAFFAVTAQYNAGAQPKPAEDNAQLAMAKTSGVPTIGQIETLAKFDGPMPTGVTVSHTGRIFICFPRWGDAVDFTVAEIKDGKHVAYPDANFNRLDEKRPGDCLVCVQSVVVDANDHLWILDPAAPNLGKALSGGPKLVCVDLNSNKVVKTINFPAEVALPTTYLNDIRFDIRRNLGFITDSAGEGPNAIIVVNLETGKSWRRLHDHPSTKADGKFTPTVEGEPLLMRTPGQQPQHLNMGSDGIAISADGNTLFYCPLISHHLYSVSTDALADQSRSDSDVAATVRDLGDRGFASDGLESDAQGRIYLTDYEHNGIQAREPDGNYRFVVRSPHIIWPDTLSLAQDGHLYFINNQLNRMPRFHDGKDLRQKPYTLMRVKVDVTSVMLK